MYPATIFEYVDKSEIAPLPIDEVALKPMFMAAFTSDKGPEKFTVVEGKAFFDLYGNTISFAKHGQPLLQAATAINAGARLFAKRVVAPDALRANLALVAEVSSAPVQKTNATGQPLYTGTGGTETTEPFAADGTTPNPPVVVAGESTCKIKYATKTAATSKTTEEAAIQIKADLAKVTPPAGTKIFPLYCFGDTGRGTSKKKWQITPDYASSKSSDYTKYMFNVLEGNYSSESVQFAFDPDQTEFDKNVSLQSIIKTNSKQMECYQYDEDVKAFMAEVCTITKMTPEEYSSIDMLFGMSKKGEPLKAITVDPTGINLSHPYGQDLKSGTNGAFGDAPMKETTYETEMAKVFTGEAGNEVYDLDNYKIDVVVDANYPAAVKRAIEKLVTFREDCMYLRDLGTNITSVDAVKAALKDAMMNKFCATYAPSFDIIDPYSKKQITVTMGYSLTRLLVNHFINGRNRPLAGILNNFIVTDAIEGTVSFTPVITPTVNQKEEMEDLRVNYASYYDNRLVVESTYTSQEKLTQFSYVNNILAIQEVIKAIRTACPKMRYGFIDGQDLEKYKNDVQKILDRYTGNFMSMTLEYISDAVYISNKIFYAAIKVQFRNFVQTEYFKVIALPS